MEFWGLCMGKKSNKNMKITDLTHHFPKNNKSRLLLKTDTKIVKGVCQDSATLKTTILMVSITTNI